MIMTNAIIYIFLSYAMFDPLFYSPLEIPKSASPPFLPKLKIFQAPLQKGGEDTMKTLYKIHAWNHFAN